LKDIRQTLGENTEGLFIRNRQEIPQDFLDGLKDYRNATASEPCKDHVRVASIPVSVAHAWKQQGFDVFEMTIPEIIKKLKADGLDMFLTTDKAF